MTHPVQKIYDDFARGGYSIHHAYKLLTDYLVKTIPEVYDGDEAHRGSTAGDQNDVGPQHEAGSGKSGA